MADAPTVSWEQRALAPDVKRTASVFPTYTLILYQANAPSVRISGVSAPRTQIIYQANAPIVKNTGNVFPNYGLIVYQALQPGVALVPFSIIPIAARIEYRALEPLVGNAPGVSAPTAIVEWRALEPSVGASLAVETAHIVFRAQGQGGVEGAVVHFRAQELAGISRVAQWTHVEFSAIEPDVGNELRGAGGGHVVGPPIRIRQDGGQRQVPTTTRRGTLFNA